MQCQLCEKAATVHLTEIVNNHKIERHLCEQCAQKEGITIKTHIPISELLNNIVASQQEAEELTDIHCPQCKLSWLEFRKRGLLGCPNDYLVFEKPLEKLIRRAQAGMINHVGRIPRHSRDSQGKQLRLMQLRQNLHDAVEAEDYETAAGIRDEINNLN